MTLLHFTLLYVTLLHFALLYVALLRITLRYFASLHITLRYFTSLAERHVGDSFVYSARSPAPNRAKRARWLCLPGKIDRASNDTPSWASLRLAASFFSVGWERLTGDWVDDTSAAQDMLTVRFGNDVIAKAQERSSTQLLLVGEGGDTADIKVGGLR